MIIKELKEINPIYLKDKLSIKLVANVSGVFYTDYYMLIEDETYRHEAYQVQYHRQTKFVALSFMYVLLVLSLMLFFKLPIPLLQFAAFYAILMLAASLIMLAVDMKKQIAWHNRIVNYFKNPKNKSKSGNCK